MVETSELISIGGKKQPVEYVAKKSGYPNSGVLCWNMDDLIGVFSHGMIDGISPDDALRLANYMKSTGQLEEILSNGEVIGWNLHSNEHAKNIVFTGQSEGKSSKKKRIHK